MINKLGFTDYEMYCDECNTVLDNYYCNDDFQEIIQRAKSEGWLIKKDKTRGEWNHYCPDCREEIV